MNSVHCSDTVIEKVMASAMEYEKKVAVSQCLQNNNELLTKYKPRMKSFEKWHPSKKFTIGGTGN